MYRIKLQSYQILEFVSHCFSPGIPVSSINKTDCHDITEMFLKVVLNTITLIQFLKNILCVLLVLLLLVTCF